MTPSVFVEYIACTVCIIAHQAMRWISLGRENLVNHILLPLCKCFREHNVGKGVQITGSGRILKMWHSFVSQCDLLSRFRDSITRYFHLTIIQMTERGAEAKQRLECDGDGDGDDDGDG